MFANALTFPFVVEFSQLVLRSRTPRSHTLDIVDEMTQDAIHSGSVGDISHKPTREELRGLYSTFYDDTLDHESPRRSCPTCPSSRPLRFRCVF